MPTNDAAGARAQHQRLYINVDHVATLRQARRGDEPDPFDAARACEDAGADGITAHLREDRRHIQDADVERIARGVRTVFNLEMACTGEMLALAERLRPHQATLVPEKREEVTTEGGLDVAHDRQRLAAGIARLNAAGVRSSLFIDPDDASVRAAHDLGARAIELHTGTYANHPGDPAPLRALQRAAELAASLGLAVHAGHGLTVANVRAVAAIPVVEELNIGHSVISRAVFIGIGPAVQELRRAMDEARRAP
ncbi:MAG TPA: pyridoxine 5'-phosphate synthase [Gemmatimonadaceae bacterium]|jgi:pyridoxine 5-phosphate synthase|nr:pyridoxine 5'-phosphate synthase [Gemmatimonadaceae bacterium]